LLIPEKTSGEPVPRRVGVETLPSRLEQAYNAGRRKIGYGGFSLSFERGGRTPR
jgi:hypothetical protein